MNLRCIANTSSSGIYHDLKAKYPTIQDLADANQEDVVEVIRTLGLQNHRAKNLIAIAQQWLVDPSAKGRRHRTLHYPYNGAGKDIKPREILEDDDEREGAWEIAHLPGVGDYAIDSWRIFCRDVLRGVATGYDGEGADAREHFEPEWMRVKPADKELKVCGSPKTSSSGWLARSSGGVQYYSGVPSADLTL